MTRKELSRIGQKLESDVRRFEDAKADFAASFATNPNYAMQWKAAPVMLAQARYEIAADLIPELDEGDEGPVDWDEADLAPFEEALARWMRNTIHRLDLRFEGRSTSAMANLVEDAENAATAELLQLVLQLQGEVL